MIPLIDINLLKTKTTAGLLNKEVVSKLQFISISALVLLMLFGVITGVMHMLYQRKLAVVTEQRERVLDEIIKNAKKEAIFRSIKAHIPVVSEVFEYQPQMHKVIDDVLEIAEPPVLQTIDVSDDMTVSISLNVDSVYSAILYTGRVIDLANQQIIHNPMLNSFFINDEGGMQLSIHYKSIR